MIEASLWHPVAQADALGGEPLAVRLLGRDLVLWRGADAQAVHAFADRCPHRGTRLSLGRVLREGAQARLECPYHGWQFDAAGQCTAVPALPDFTPPPSHRACRHEVQQAHGLLWVRLAPGEGGLPAFPAEQDPLLRKLLCGPYDVAASAPRIVENFLDLAHFGFVHEGWLGAREHAQVDAYRIESTAHGFVASACRAWQPRSNRLSSEGSWVDYRYELTAPYAAVLTKLPQRQDDYRDEIGLFVCPRDAASSRVWFRLAVTDFDSSDEELRAFQHAIFTQDQPVLESQTPACLPLDTPPHGSELHCAADRSAAAYRRVLRERGITFGTCQP